MDIKDFIYEKIEEYEQNEMSEEVIGEIVDEVVKTYNIKCDYFYAGDFDSPGYDCYYYVIVFINEYGNLEGVDVQVESY